VDAAAASHWQIDDISKEDIENVRMRIRKRDERTMESEERIRRGVGRNLARVDIFVERMDGKE
jgi:hypothetical protein